MTGLCQNPGLGYLAGRQRQLVSNLIHLPYQSFANREQENAFTLTNLVTHMCAHMDSISAYATETATQGVQAVIHCLKMEIRYHVPLPDINMTLSYANIVCLIEHTHKFVPSRLFFPGPLGFSDADFGHVSPPAL